MQLNTLTRRDKKINFMLKIFIKIHVGPTVGSGSKTV